MTNSSELQPDCITNDEDCAGVCAGTAYTDPHFSEDDCTVNTCVEGNAGKTACVLDCNNEWGDGSATNYYYYYDNDVDGVAGLP